ncbi:ribonuclease H-like domain-containing protein, partial [Amylostereum chailletii]
IITQIGLWRVSRVASDNTGNTRSAHRKICEKYSHIHNAQDSCHELSLTHKDICALPEFKEIIDLVRVILKFMSQSTLAAQPFEEARKRLKIGRGLETIGATRFGTLSWASDSVRRCLRAFRLIIQEDPDLDIAMNLTTLLTVILPFARAIRCLESSHGTAADVLIFWAACIAQLSRHFKSTSCRLSEDTKASIRYIVNRRFNGMINKAHHDIYVVAVYLDSRAYLHADWDPTYH